MNPIELYRQAYIAKTAAEQDKDSTAKNLAIGGALPLAGISGNRILAKLWPALSKQERKIDKHWFINSPDSVSRTIGRRVDKFNDALRNAASKLSPSSKARLNGPFMDAGAVAHSVELGAERLAKPGSRILPLMSGNNTPITSAIASHLTDENMHGLAGKLKQSNMRITSDSLNKLITRSNKINKKLLPARSRLRALSILLDLGMFAVPAAGIAGGAAYITKALKNKKQK